MSSKADQYLSRYLSRFRQNLPSKKIKTDKRGKKSQAVVAEEVTPDLNSRPTRLSDPSTQPSEQGGTSSVRNSHAWTNLIRLGADVPPGASILNGSINAAEFASRLTPPADLQFLSTQDVTVLHERYLKHMLEAMLVGQVFHAQCEIICTKALAEKSNLQKLLAAREDELGRLKAEQVALEAELKQEQEHHEKTHATIAALRESHAIALNDAEETYKRSSKFKGDAKDYMGRTEGAKEFMKTKVGQEAIEAESQVAFDLGMYTHVTIDLFGALREPSQLRPISHGLASDG